MLNFSSDLSSALNKDAVETFWCLKLYFNAEGSSDFYGFSDQDRTDGSDFYYGIIASWGRYSQSLDFFNFTTSIGNMIISLVNTNKTIDGGRFSDLFSSNNFANRKWELFQCAPEITYDTTANMIGSGVISGDIKYDSKMCSLVLLDYGVKHHKQIPANIIDSTTYPNAPKENIGIPLPIVFGDFDIKTNVSTAGARFDRHETKAKFPAPIIDEWHKTDARVEGRLDSQNMHTLNNNRVYTYMQGLFVACDESTVSANSALNEEQITAKGAVWYVYTPLKKHGTYDAGNYGNTVDGDHETGYLISASGTDVAYGWRIPKIPKLGTFTDLYFLFNFEDFSVLAPDVGFGIDELGIAPVSYPLAWDDGDKQAIITWYGASKETDWDFEGEVFIILDDRGGAGTVSVNIRQIGMVVKFSPTDLKIDTKIIQYERTSSKRVKRSNDQFAGDIIDETITLTQKVDVPNYVAKMLYASGKGRKYGAFIDADSRNQGYNKGDLIENAVFMIEDMLRRELGNILTGTDTAGTPNRLTDAGASFTNVEIGRTIFNLTDGTSAQITALDSGTVLRLDADIFDTNEYYYIGGLTSDEIDYDTFDISGNTTDGYLKDIYDDAIADILFAFSQYKFINSKDSINKLCRQILSWVFIGGDGKFKIKTLRRPTDYASANKTIDFRDIDLKRIYKTPIGSVRNDITVNYNYDYGQDKNLSQENTTDSTSQGTTVSGYNQTLNLILDADGILDETTATKLAGACLTIFKDRKVRIDIVCNHKYNELEIGDIIDWTEWDSNIDIFGSAMVENGAGHPDYYMVENTFKLPNSSTLKLIKVSE